MSRVGEAWDEVGAGVLRRRYAWLDQNIVLIITDDGLVVVDSRSNHVDADELLGDIALVSRAPIRYLVNTHFHWDHTFGNARFPAAQVLGHTRCREVMITNGERTLSRACQRGMDSARQESVLQRRDHQTADGDLP